MSHLSRNAATTTTITTNKKRYTLIDVHNQPQQTNERPNEQTNEWMNVVDDDDNNEKRE